jgi:Ca2+-binding EF-hand superfamily protein
MQAKKEDQELILRAQTAFNMFDTNRSGTISGEELLGVLRSMGQDPT